MFLSLSLFYPQAYPLFLWRVLYLSVIMVMMQFILIYAANIPVLQIGSVTRGTTSRTPHLVDVDMYSSGQALLEVHVSRLDLTRLQRRNSTLSVTTCSTFTNFDTVLYAFTSNPLNRNTSIAWVNKNDNDCGLHSTVQMTVSAETAFYILLTGYRGSEGTYEVRAEEVGGGDIPISWGLDRIDQRLLPLDGQFSLNEAGQGVFIYVLDSGVRASHNEFLRKDGTSRVLAGKDFVERLAVLTDETGHGTHVAALAAGKSFGVAKQATIVSVRVLDRTNAGLISQLVEALEWTTNDIYQKNNIPAIIAMSLSTSASETLNDAVAKVTSAGVAVVTAAGNDGKNSCLTSPASETSALTVGATDSKDQSSIISNWGECVNIYAPGEGILSAWHTGDSASKKLSGTSAACPLVAGATAILLEQNPRLKPDEIREVISATATLSVKENNHFTKESTRRVVSVRKTRLRRLLYVRSIPVVVRDGRPPQGKMFLYVIFRLPLNREKQKQCNLKADHVNSVRGILSSVFGEGLKTSVALRMCCQGRVNNDCDDGSAFPGNRLVVRILTRDVYAYSAFESLVTFCREKGGTVQQLRTALDMNVSVAVEPWVLDSRGYKYWAAPALVHTANRRLSTTQIVGVACLITMLLLCLIVAGLCLIQCSKKKQQQKDQDYFEEKATEYEVEKKRHANLHSHEDLKPTPFSSQGMSRINSELQGDILKCLSPSGVIPTPTAPSPRTAQPDIPWMSHGTKKGMSLNVLSKSAEAPKVQAQADQLRAVRGSLTQVQTSTSFFKMLWTSRPDRQTATVDSSLGKSFFRGLPRILSFGPERGAVVQPTLPSPVGSGLATQRTEGSAKENEAVANAVQTPAPSERAET